MAWETVPPPNYAAFDNSALVGNALGNLVSNYQQAQQGQQRTQANDLRNQQDKMLLDQSKAFAGGVPMKNGMPDWPKIAAVQAEKGNVNALAALAPYIQHQQDIEGANAPDQFFPGGGGAATGGVDPVSTVVGAESSGQNIPQQIHDANTDKGTPAQGFFQIIDPTWREYAPQAGVDLAKYPSAIDAPYAVQAAVAQKIPINQWGPKTVAALNAKFRGLNVDETLGEAEAQYGGGGTQVASLDPSDATAYANPDTPAVPPVSAAAGSTIPRADGGDSTPKGAVGGAHAGAAPQQWAQNGPAWAGINGALPVGPAAAPAAPGPAARPAQAPAAPGQASVASLVSGMVSDPQMGVRVAGNVARALKVDPAAPLTPEQALKAQLYVKNYAARVAQQPASAPQAAPGGPGQPSPGGPITFLSPVFRRAIRTRRKPSWRFVKTRRACLGSVPQPMAGSIIWNDGRTASRRVRRR